MIKLVTSEQIRNHEAELIKKMGPQGSLALMEKAGLALADVAKMQKDPYLIICGKGNNGGDGITAARHLHAAGKKVYLFLTSDEQSLSSDAKANLNLIKEKVTPYVINGENDVGLTSTLKNANTVVDCILGTGSSKQLSSLFDWIIKTINDSKKYIIACDIPTGVNPDTGAVSTKAIKANTTVTLGYPKLGLAVYPGIKCVGELKIIDIGLKDIETNTFLLDDTFLKDSLPKRDNESNKGSFGRTLLVCGSRQYPGAAVLASTAASSIGSGLTSLASPNEALSKITPAIPEVIQVDFNQESIVKESTKSTAVVIGPGLTTESNIKTLVSGLIEKINVPIVLDADGINVFSGNKALIKKAKNEVIITPHPKEFARLLGISTEEVIANKIELVKNTAKELNCTVILKGPATIIGTGDGKLYISPFSNSALAKGGTGDVLAGFIGGLISQGLKPSLAACAGVYLHGKVGEVVSNEKTVFSLLPQDLISYLPNVLKVYI